MLLLISCAKTMKDTSKYEVSQATVPLFIQEAREIALQMSQFSVQDLEVMLKVNSKIAVENYKRYQSFHSTDTTELPALLAYTGIVFKRLNPTDFTMGDFLYAQKHLRITSFCYGMLRPLDAIRLYRLEGDVRLPGYHEGTLFSYWQSKLTDLFISDIKASGGVLFYLASDEMRGLFDWKKVLREIKVVTPEFHVHKNGKLSTIVVYTKMARGEMTRFIIKNRIDSLETLKSFTWEGFRYDENLSNDEHFVYTVEG
ncbi:peroxide stress protein YaaA [uncultured Bacteroides sp.]|uniref:peroxide stress protein YaaA n=1 Tax=uncultured Bacteroides sp. TaxID=162156 RepID=UPI002AAC3FA7|nr:peroxide stress protein YaaA [uncultured Bacteroides sp.]